MAKRYFYIKGYKVKNNMYNEPQYIQSLHKKSVKKIVDGLPKDNLFNKSKIIHTGSFAMDWKVTELWQKVNNDLIVY